MNEKCPICGKIIIEAMIGGDEVYYIHSKRPHWKYPGIMEFTERCAVNRYTGEGRKVEYYPS